MLAGQQCTQADVPVCAGFVYVQNNCSLPISATIKVSAKPCRGACCSLRPDAHTSVQLAELGYSGQPCISIAGHSLNTWAIIVIAVVAVVVVIIGIWVLSCLCCQALTCFGCCCCR